jgi:pimeloyl-ACP methyl ester carboxylesterase
MSSFNEQDCIVVSKASTYTNFSHSKFEMVMQRPLPGIIIFVHGVNSDGEWYEQAEQGLCAGLNDRLARNDEQLLHKGPAAGQMCPAKYGAELTDDGFINPEIDSESFINQADTFSPVIRFRWGHKASGEELQLFGDSIYLNEKNYWGGGPFANGCTALPDLWNLGLSENLFLWMQVEHLNPVNERQVYSCPPRGYYVLAAYRLAKLVESIRKEQADTPITIVCHSQGNMIGMAAAFLGDRMSLAGDRWGKSGPCVADNYVLCNPPYSLVESNFAENWTARHLVDQAGRTGRQTREARVATLAAFFDIIRERHALNALQTADHIDDRMASKSRQFTAQNDREKYGLNGSTYGRVTLYCNPHDQVISSTTVQGIGWRGLSNRNKFNEIMASRADGVFTQRVFAQGFEVGRQGTYHYWRDHWRQPKPGSKDFWYPHSKPARYSITKGLSANKSFAGCFFTVATWPAMTLLTSLAKTPINAMPDDDWEISLRAPTLPEPFVPESVRLDHRTENFDQHYDPPGAFRDKHRIRHADDPYAGDRELPHDRVGLSSEVKKTDSAEGNSKDEAELRYEHHAKLRMQAKRQGRYANNAPVTDEDQPENASDDYKVWRNKQIKTTLAESVDTAATDHSTIMTNPMHARKALAYDVAVGVCDISQHQLLKLRASADWRRLQKLGNPIDPVFQEYFSTGLVKSTSAHSWANSSADEGHMPDKIIDIRQNQRQAPTVRGNHDAA